MAVAELYGKRRKSGTQIEREFKVSGPTEDDAARAELLASGDVPAALGDFVRVDKECGVEELATGLWLGTAIWKIPDEGEQEEPAINSFTVSIDISGQSQRITQAVTHVADYAPTGKTPRTFYGAIGVTPDGIEGCDILIPQMQFVANYKIDAVLITDTYIRETVPSIVGTMNAGAFLGYAAGELLLTRVSGTKRYDAEEEIWVWDLSFGFSVSRNATAIEIVGADGTITVAEKLGWDYLWIYYEDRTVTNAGMTYTAKVPVSAHVEQVYWDADYSVLIVTP